MTRTIFTRFRFPFPKEAARQIWPLLVKSFRRKRCSKIMVIYVYSRGAGADNPPPPPPQLELSASNTVKVDYRLPVTCSDFNSTTVNSLGLDFIDLLPVTLSISYRCLNVVSNTDFYAICSHYYHFSNRIVTNIILL